MNKLLLSCCLLLASAHMAFGQKDLPGQYNGYVKYESTPGLGLITVTCSGFGKKKQQSLKDAAAGAFYNLLFRGIPGSQQELPMIPDENEAKNNRHVRDILDGGYSAFVIENNLLGEEPRKKKKDGAKGVLTTHTMTISCEALRHYLEQNNVIRKFGY